MWNKVDGDLVAADFSHNPSPVYKGKFLPSTKNSPGNQQSILFEVETVNCNISNVLHSSFCYS